MNHKDVVARAVEWAQSRHQLVIRERSAIYEIPDVVGISYSYTTMIECKASRSDFLADKKKLSRLDGNYCVGNYRIYCAPKGILNESEIPDGWGFLEIYPSGFLKLNVNIYKYSRPNIFWHEDTVQNLRAEKRMMFNHFMYPRLNSPAHKGEELEVGL